MTYKRFSYLVSGLDWETQHRIDAEIARISVEDRDLEYVDWEALLNQHLAAEYYFYTQNRKG